MAGRGRGRGRGRGSQMSFDYSQLGFSGGEALPAPVLQPPPTFPPLENKAVPLMSGPESEYMVALKRDFVEFLHSIRQDSDSSSMIERFSDKYQTMSSLAKDSWDSQINWDYFPAELNPKGKKAFKRKLEKADKGDKGDNVPIGNKRQNFDVSKKLDELAKLEVKEEEGERGEGGEEEDAREAEEEESGHRENAEEEEGEGEGEEDEDEEMDDGTDYVNNYFDTGEGYIDDEDDNLDDGPVY